MFYVKTLKIAIVSNFFDWLYLAYMADEILHQFCIIEISYILKCIEIENHYVKL